MKAKVTITFDWEDVDKYITDGTTTIRGLQAYLEGELANSEVFANVLLDLDANSKTTIEVDRGKKVEVRIENRGRYYMYQEDINTLNDFLDTKKER